MSSTITIIIIIICIALCLISGQGVCFKVSGCTGGSLLFKCTYSDQRNSDEESRGAYLKRKEGSSIISTEIQQRWDYKDRFALYDDENSRFFQVYIKNLSKEDEGEYECGKNKWKHNVEIDVENEASCGTSVIQAAVLGQESTFLCKYPEKYKTHTKVFYKMNPDPVLVLSSSSHSSTDNFNMSDSQKDHFNVTTRSASTADGEYFCGVEKHGSDNQPSSVNHTTFIQHIHLNITTKLTSALVQAYISRSVYIKCQFPQQLKTNKKFFQNAQKITVARQNEWERQGKVHMYDDTTEGRLKVFISDLTAADEGTYTCGVEVNDNDLITEVKLKVNQAHELHDNSKATVFTGETANFICNHPAKNTMTTNYICKENDAEICQNIPSLDRKNIQLSDSAAGVFTVSFSNVSLTDQGVYWCALKTKDKHLTSISTTTKLELALTMPPVVGREGASVQIRCPNTSNHIRYLCKGKCFTPDGKILIQSDEAHVEKPKISVMDQSSFTVNISNLTAEDAGIYWCAEKNTYNISTNLMIVMKDAPVTHQASVGGSVSISCKHITTHTHHQRLFCRGTQPSVCVRDGVLVSSNTATNERFSLTDQCSAGVFTVKISRLGEGDSGTYWCGEESSGSYLFTEVHLNVNREQILADSRIAHYVISAVSVGLILMAVCLLLMFLFKRKRNSKPDTRQTGAHESTTPSTAPEEIPGSAPLNSTVQTPTKPSDGLLYAAVSFQKHDESLSEAAVAFNKDEPQCEYATVNHRSTADH